ncbi:MAG: hypothetical protein IPJ94_03370 [Chloroflexi bacterium]|nr:hypothetical protein [Chloroflexota bacterium]
MEFGHIPNKALWTGSISKEAIRSFHPLFGVDKPKLTEDHQFPRKVAARALLEFDWAGVKDPQAEITKMFVEKYGTYNFLVTSSGKQGSNEAYQKVEVFSLTPKSPMQQAGIVLLDIILNNFNSSNVEIALLLKWSSTDVHNEATKTVSKCTG